MTDAEKLADGLERQREVVAEQERARREARRSVNTGDIRVAARASGDFESIYGGAAPADYTTQFRPRGSE